MRLKTARPSISTRFPPPPTACSTAKTARSGTTQGARARSGRRARPLVGYKQETVRVYINNVNEAPASPTLNDGLVVNVVENSTVIGTLRAVDPETPSCTFKFADGSVTDGTFVIDGNQLKVRRRGKAQLRSDAERPKVSTTSYAHRGRWGGSRIGAQTFTINVTNAPSEPNAAPDNPVLLTDTINETAQIGDIVGLLGAARPGRRHRPLQIRGRRRRPRLRRLDQLGRCLPDQRIRPDRRPQPGEDPGDGRRHFQDLHLQRRRQRRQ